MSKKKQNKKLKIFIQINIGNEPQKNGISMENAKEFYLKCINVLDLDIVGLMCLPPINQSAINYFSKMKLLSDKLNVDCVSMGMSGDYLKAVMYGSTFVRIGSKIFGQRY